ncbi:MAG TPA: ribonuclease HII [Candidatus Paceibacterota bacterium]|nr:ribonuclease HII [Candidatus Paceibacterota bacterium]
MKSKGNFRPEYIIGIDEVGRGPLAGPTTVGVSAVCTYGKKPPVLTLADDSKAMSPEMREYIFAEATRVRNKTVWFEVSSVAASVIDTVGINKAIYQAMVSALKKLEARGIGPHNSFVYLDGGLRAPEGYHQKTIIRGDSKVKVISLASIVAKVTRDRLMDRMGKKYAAYGFGQHKGYGTAGHRQAIREFGLSNIHRRSFCSRYGQSQA